MKKISFTKMSGAGNDFIVIDKNQNPSLQLDVEKIIKICNRRNGIGADGVITILDSKEYDFVMEYFNADGSTGSLCGNGARCAIKFANETRRFSGRTKFLSNGESYSGEVIEEDVIKFNLNSPKKIKTNFKVKAFNQLINSSFLDTGSPHVVIKIDEVLSDQKNPSSSYKDLNIFPVFELGKEIRYHKDFAPGGTNVNFIKVIENKIFIRTYERGVEDETLACGTGSAAAAIAAFLNYNLIPPISLETKGGEKLVVDFESSNNKIEKLTLTGPARIIFTGEIF